MTGEWGTGLGVYIPLTIYLTGCLAAALSIFWKPQAGLYFLVLLIPLQTTRDRIGHFPLGAEMVDLLWLSILVALLMRGGLTSFPRSPLLKWLAVLAVLTYSSLWLGSLNLGIQLPIFISDPRFSDWKNYMVMPMICFVVAGALKDTKDIKYLVVFMILASAIVNWSFFRSTAGRDFSHFSYEVRDAGVLGYAGVNGFAAFVAQSIVFLSTLYFFLRERLLRLAIVIALGFSVYCLLFSFSRGAYFACLLGVSFMALFKQKKLLLGILVLVVTWQVILPNAVQERINMTYDKSDNTLEPSAGDRVMLWEDAIGLFFRSPVMGTGFDTYQFMHRVGYYKDTHNYYMKVIVEMGLVGLFLLLVILIRMFLLGFQLFRRAEEPFLQGLGLGFAALIVCTALANLFGDRWTYLQVDGYMWVLLGCVMRGISILSEDKSRRAIGLEGANITSTQDLRQNELIGVT